ncbi:MAG: type II toxin-antitoxin system RelE/ParE family toxin [Alphaproteobacteria bacterium]|nr:type II toxin-antitoxin system RelE/ParE family toxin [Alphaproteobacteria bacterium]MBL6939206.1 type II toxin-antitoxin system RelE/ParE family toxin [Alphaproteobacteria bacterium]MBL7096722.1 type II toxin-antitoxin system RelE/ParE family toxin [Alphaproteobacteria bacterium]
MITIEQTANYRRWFERLRDRAARARIDTRLVRLANGNPGEIRFVGGGVLELKIDYGPGYRVYYKRKGTKVLLLLVGGDKRTQASDIELAIELAAASKD